MNRFDREWQIKLELLASIARSQASLAAMLEHAAQVVTAADISPVVLREHVRAIADMQEALLTAATGTRWRKPRQGIPGAPWLSENARVRENRAGRRLGGTGGVAW